VDPWLDKESGSAKFKFSVTSSRQPISSNSWECSRSDCPIRPKREIIQVFNSVKVLPPSAVIDCQMGAGSRTKKGRALHPDSAAVPAPVVPIDADPCAYTLCLFCADKKADVLLGCGHLNTCFDKWVEVHISRCPTCFPPSTTLISQSIEPRMTKTSVHSS
jgi:hypothetical protein